MRPAPARTYMARSPSASSPGRMPDDDSNESVSFGRVPRLSHARRSHPHSHEPSAELREVRREVPAAGVLPAAAGRAGPGRRAIGGPPGWTGPGSMTAPSRRYGGASSVTPGASRGIAEQRPKDTGSSIQRSNRHRWVVGRSRRPRAPRRASRPRGRGWRPWPWSRVTACLVSTPHAERWQPARLPTACGDEMGECGQRRHRLEAGPPWSRPGSDRWSFNQLTEDVVPPARPRVKHVGQSAGRSGTRLHRGGVGRPSSPSWYHSPTREGTTGVLVRAGTSGNFSREDRRAPPASHLPGRADSHQRDAGPATAHRVGDAVRRPAGVRHPVEGEPDVATPGVVDPPAGHLGMDAEQATIEDRGGPLDRRRQEAGASAEDHPPIGRDVPVVQEVLRVEERPALGRDVGDQSWQRLAGDDVAADRDDPAAQVGATPSV